MTCAKRLVEHFNGRKEAAEGMKVSAETIRLWLRDGIPLERAVDVENATGGIISGEDILREVREKAAA